MAGGKYLDELWARSAAGDVESFNTLFDELSADIFRFARYRLTSDSEADDVVAETFLYLWKGRVERPDNDVSVRAWAFGIASNLVKRRWRSGARADRALTRLSAFTEIERISADEASDLVSSIESRARVRNVRIALDRLPPAMTDILVMRAWDEMEYGEIAYVLDCPIGTVRSRLARARDRLKTEISKIEREPNGHTGHVPGDSSNTMRFP